LDDTLIVFTSDHGEWLGEHLKYGKGYPGLDCISRVPLVIRWPEMVSQSGRTIHEIVEAVDLVPTLLECAGIQLPSDLRGQSLVPFLQNDYGSHDKPAIMEHKVWK